MKVLTSIILIVFLIVSSASAKENYLIFLVSPMVSPVATISNFSEFVKYLEKRTGKKIILKQRRSYDEINELLKNGQAHFAYLCTGGYLAGRQQFGLEILVTPMIRNKLTYNSYIIVRKNSRIKDIAQLKGKIFAFTDPLSLTGKLFMTALINEKGYLTKNYFSRTFYTGGHENSIEAVVKGLADGAAVHSIVFDEMKKRKETTINEVKIIMKSPDFGNPPFVVSPMLSEKEKKQLLKILITMHKDKLGKKILDLIGIDRFVYPESHIYFSAHKIYQKVRE
ncbi:phosphate/phosphite/phosphonate ABC transporter substrate-binding protein [Thermodesulfovibrio sp. 3907-1M]|uniref:Phosphate/phosphite/phosphonate ABC transporter substrate-binding protein n=1 Tax=Thermodesulfovibrio autotrophicus TaxID=3118333 RepID=A0AAU8GY32_9BACT